MPIPKWLFAFPLIIMGVFFLWCPANIHRPYFANKTVITDRKATFLDSAGEYRFARHFFDLPYADTPQHNFLSLKNATERYIENSHDFVSILPTIDYQAVYVHVQEGQASVHIHMCVKGGTVFGGEVHKGWNLLALDFPKLIELSNCTQFSMETDRPVLEFSGTADFAVWRMERILFFDLPYYAGLPLLIGNVMTAAVALLLIVDLFIPRHGFNAAVAKPQLSGQMTTSV